MESSGTRKLAADIPVGGRAAGGIPCVSMRGLAGRASSHAGMFRGRRVKNKRWLAARYEPKVDVEEGSTTFRLQQEISGREPGVQVWWPRRQERFVQCLQSPIVSGTHGQWPCQKKKVAGIILPAGPGPGIRSLGRAGGRTFDSGRERGGDVTLVGILRREKERERVCV